MKCSLCCTGIRRLLDYFLNAESDVTVRIFMVFIGFRKCIYIENKKVLFYLFSYFFNLNIRMLYSFYMNDNRRWRVAKGVQEVPADTDVVVGG